MRQKFLMLLMLYTDLLELSRYWWGERFLSCTYPLDARGLLSHNKSLSEYKSLSSPRNAIATFICFIEGTPFPN